MPEGEPQRHGLLGVAIQVELFQESEQPVQFEKPFAALDALLGRLRSIQQHTRFRTHTARTLATGRGVCSKPRTIRANGPLWVVCRYRDRNDHRCERLSLGKLWLLGRLELCQRWLWPAPVYRLLRVAHSQRCP